MKNVTFKDQQPTWAAGVPTELDGTYSATDTGDRVEDFFERPVRIASLTWDYDGSLNYTLNPWTLYFENAKVANRMANFRNLRGELVVKFSINGNPYYYGKLIAAYRPLHGHDNRTTFRHDNKNDLVEMSQRPHIFIDPTESTGGELVLPFFFYKNSLSIPDKEWRVMGLIDIATLSELRHANQGFEPLTINVYAYGRNVTISTPTSRTGVLEAQSEEYGMISTPAHSIANASGWLTKLPVIGKYARATQIASNAVGDTAQLFGFCSPRDLAPVERIRQTPVGNSAQVNVSNPSYALSFDAKKEVTVDPRVTGISGNDEMALVPLAKKESFVTSVTWSKDQAVDTHLLSLRVGPVQGRASSTEYHVSPSGWVSLPFNYWKGTTSFRFNIVSSAFHRGRLKFVWDPDYNEASGSVFNTNYTTVVDITSNKDFTVDVGWGQSSSYLPVGFTAALPSYSYDPITTKSALHNGVLSVFVVNELTTPSEMESPIDILVFSSMNDDFEVACPTAKLPLLKIVDTSQEAIPVSPPPPVYVPPTLNPPDGTTAPPGPVPVTPHDVFYSTHLPFVASQKWPTPLYQAPVFNLTDNKCLMEEGNTYGFSLPRFSNLTGTKFGLKMTPKTVTGGSATVVFKIYHNDVLLSGGYIDKHNIVLGQQFTLETFSTIPYASSNLCTFEVGIECNVDIVLEIDEIGCTVPSDVEYAVLDSADVVGTAENLCTVANESGGCKMTPNTPGVYSEFSISLPRLHPDSLVTLLPIEYQVNDRLYARPNQTATKDSLNLTNVTLPLRAVMTTIKSVNIATGINAYKIYLESQQVIKVKSVGYFRYKLTPQSEETPVKPQHDVPDNPAAIEMMAPMTTGALVNQIHFGEQIASWRSVLKRYVHLRKFGDVANYLEGWTDMITENTHVLEYVKSAYVGYRGSIRYKFVCTRNTATVINPFNIVHRMRPEENQASDRHQMLFSGTAMEDGKLGYVLDVEVPYYSLLRFYPARFLGNTDDEVNGYWEDHFRMNAVATTYVSACAGEDFSCQFFLCTPILRHL